MIPESLKYTWSINCEQSASYQLWHSRYKNRQAVTHVHPVDYG